jgi:hypothetical protein
MPKITKINTILKKKNTCIDVFVYPIEVSKGETILIFFKVSDHYKVQ